MDVKLVGHAILLAVLLGFIRGDDHEIHSRLLLKAGDFLLQRSLFARGKQIRPVIHARSGCQRTPA